MSETKFKVGDKVKILDIEGSWADHFRPFIIITKVEKERDCYGGPNYHFINPKDGHDDFFNNEDIFEKITPLTWKERLIQ